MSLPPGHPLRTGLAELLGAETPIVQTGMGWVATPELVAAACNAGAFGFLAAAGLPVDEVEAAIRRTRTLTERTFGVNFLMDAPGAEEIVELIIAHGVRAAGYNRAPSAALIERLKEAGVLCVPTCGAPRHVQKAEALGADAVIVQDATLLHSVDVFQGLKSDGYILINSRRSFDDLGIADFVAAFPPHHVCDVGATELALKHVGRPVPNAALLGGFAAISGQIRLESVEKAIGEKFPGQIAAANVAAAREAYAIAKAA